MKFYLRLSKDEQRKRFLQRIDEPEKNWKGCRQNLDDSGYFVRVTWTANA